MPFHDPLAFVKVPGLAEAVTPLLSDYLGYKVFPTHIEEIILATLFYHVIFVLSSKWSPILCPEYKTLPWRTQLNFDIHVVSMVQCILILGLSFPMFNDPALTDHIYGYTPYGGFVSSMAVGYFVWDSIVCLWYVKYFGIGFAVHGIAAGFVFFQGMRPILIHYCPHFLLFEVSTPFLNVNWFVTHLPNTTVSFKLQLINGIFLLASFFFVRIIWGFYQAYNVALDLLFGRSFFERQHPLWVSVGIVAANLSLDFLNVFWFYKMQLLARRAIGSSSAVSAKPDQEKKRTS